MNTVNVVWRQACSIKNKSDELVQDSDVPANYSQELSQHSSAIVLQAACADGHEEPVLCSNIASELQELQSTIWEFLKNCVNEKLRSLANRLYYACSNFKRLLRKKIAQAKAKIKQVVNNTAAPLIETPQSTSQYVLAPQIT